MTTIRSSFQKRRGGAAGAAHTFYAVGEHAAIGLSPFAIDSFSEGTTDLGASYAAIASITPILFDEQTKGNVHGFTLKGTSVRRLRSVIAMRCRSAWTKYLEIAPKTALA